MKSRLRKIVLILSQLALFILLSIISQIGGIIYILALFINRRLAKKIPCQPLLIFTVLYGIANLIIVPNIAGYFGRQPVVSHPNIKAANPAYALLNRNYVRPELNQLLLEIAEDYPIIYLDANFPFCDGFPLLPHLSHNDGKKIDLSFIYEDLQGNAVHASKSNSGYGVFQKPMEHEEDWTKICSEKGYFQYSYPSYLHFGTKNEQLSFSNKHNKGLLQRLTSHVSVEKIFIEPHLKSRLNLSHNKIRFHGCRAVRHDDHIHLQIK